MGRTGDPRATWRYSRIKYGTPAITITFEDPSAFDLAPPAIIAPSQVALDGTEETLFIRQDDLIEWQTPLMELELVRTLRRWFETHAAKGKASEFWMNRFLGSAWLFEDDLTDENGLALVLNGGGSAAYADYTVGADTARAISLGAAQYLTVPTAQESAGTPTGYDDPMNRVQGVLVVDVRPTWAANDGVEHAIVAVGTQAAANSLRLKKIAANDLAFDIYDAAGLLKRVSGTPSWNANNRVRIVAKWDSAGAMKLWYAVSSGAFTQLTGASGAGTGIITTLGATLSIGGANDGSDLARGDYGAVVFHAKAWDDAACTGVLADWRPSWRNFLQTAQLVTPRNTFKPEKPYFGLGLYRWGCVMRKGT